MNAAQDGWNWSNWTGNQKRFDTHAWRAVQGKESFPLPPLRQCHLKRDVSGCLLLVAKKRGRPCHLLSLSMRSKWSSRRPPPPPAAATAAAAVAPPPPLKRARLISSTMVDAKNIQLLSSPDVSAAAAAAAAQPTVNDILGRPTADRNRRVSRGTKDTSPRSKRHSSNNPICTSVLSHTSSSRVPVLQAYTA